MKRLHLYALATLLFAASCVTENAAMSIRPKQARADRASAVAALAGEFRTVAANLLWIKADRYHHEFIEKNPNWTQNTDLLGILHMITRLDPRFDVAYSSGALIYAYGSNQPRRAIQYLSEGIAHNPRSWDLHRIAAIIYARRLHDPAKALPHAREAARLCNDNFYKPSLTRLLKTIEDSLDQKTANTSHVRH